MMYKKKRNKALTALFAFMLAALICIPTAFSMSPEAARKKPTPGKVKLTKIAATDYNKICSVNN